MDINILAIPRFSPSTMSESKQIKLFSISGGGKKKTLVEYILTYSARNLLLIIVVAVRNLFLIIVVAVLSIFIF